MTVLSLQVAASADDAYQDYGATADTAAASGALGTGATGSSPQRATGLRFAGVTIPPGSTINSAILTLRKAGTDWQSVQLTWYGQAADNAGAFSGGEDITARALTSASLACDESISRTDGSWYSVPTGSDLKALVQEIVNRVGWASGNALVLIGRGNGSLSFSSSPFRHYDTAAGDAAKLDIDYSGGGSLENIRYDYSKHFKLALVGLA